MKKKQRTPQGNVKKFMRGKQPIQASNLKELAAVLVAESGVSVAVTENCLRKEIRGRRLFKHRDEKTGVVTFEPAPVRKIRLGYPSGIHRSWLINGRHLNGVSEGAEA